MAGQFDLRCRLPRISQGCFTCRKSATWDRRIYFPSEGRHSVDFFRPKIPTASAGFEPAILDTTRPMKPLIPKSTELSSSLSARHYQIYCFRKYRNFYFSCRTEHCHLSLPVPFNRHTVLPTCAGFTVQAKWTLCGSERKSKIKPTHYRPWQALRVPAVRGSQTLRQSAHEGGKVVSPTYRPPLPQEMFLVHISFRGWVDPRATVRPEGLCQWIIQWNHRVLIPQPSGL
jgi:hypothetical protein